MCAIYYIYKVFSKTFFILSAISFILVKKKKEDYISKNKDLKYLLSHIGKTNLMFTQMSHLPGK